MSTVDEAVGPTIGRKVAIRKVTAVLTDEPELLERFYRQKVMGESEGIAPPDTLSGTPVFKTGAINRSATSPFLTVYRRRETRFASDGFSGSPATRLSRSWRTETLWSGRTTAIHSAPRARP